MPLLSNTAPASANIYAQSDALSAAQTQVLLAAALVLLVVGFLLIEGRVLRRTYQAFIHFIGVRHLPAQAGESAAHPQPRPW